MIEKYIYNSEKNRKLLAERGVGFEEIIQTIADGNLLDTKVHPNQKQYPKQEILYVRLINEVYAVPCIKEKNDTTFLKTLFPTRKARKRLLGL